MLLLLVPTLWEFNMNTYIDQQKFKQLRYFANFGYNQLKNLKPFKMSKSIRKDLYEAPDYYLVDELLSEEHLLVRASVRDWVKKEVSPIIEDYAQRAEFPKQLIKGLGEIGAFGPTIPVEYGGAGLDYTAYGIIMQEIERGDSGIRSTASVQGSLVMYPIYAYGTEEQRKK